MLVSLLPSPSVHWGAGGGCAICTAGSRAEGGQGPPPCPALGLAQDAAMLAGWPGLTPQRAVPVHPLPPGCCLVCSPPTLGQTRFPRAYSRVAATSPGALGEDEGQGWATEVMKWGDGTIAGCSRVLGISRRVPGVSLCGSPCVGCCWLGAQLWPQAGAAWALGGSVWQQRGLLGSRAACDAAALTSILCRRRRSRRGD